MNTTQVATMDLLKYSTIGFDADHNVSMIAANSSPISADTREAPPRKRPRKQSLAELETSESKEEPYWMRDENAPNITAVEKRKIKKAKKSRAFREKQNQRHNEDQSIITELRAKVAEMEKQLLEKEEMIQLLWKNSVNSENMEPPLPLTEIIINTKQSYPTNDSAPQPHLEVDPIILIFDPELDFQDSIFDQFDDIASTLPPT